MANLSNKDYGLEFYLLRVKNKITPAKITPPTELVITIFQKLDTNSSINFYSSRFFLTSLKVPFHVLSQIYLVSELKNPESLLSEVVIKISLAWEGDNISNSTNVCNNFIREACQGLSSNTK